MDQTHAITSEAWRAAKNATGAPANLRLYDLRHHGATLTARKPGVTTKELMARVGHSSWKAALIYQHAAAERDHEVADFMDDAIARVERPKKAPVIDLAADTRGVGVGLDAGDRKRRRSKKAPDLQEQLEAATGIEPVYRALQALA